MQALNFSQFSAMPHKIMLALNFSQFSAMPHEIMQALRLLREMADGLKHLLKLQAKQFSALAEHVDRNTFDRQFRRTRMETYQFHRGAILQMFSP